MKAKVGAISMVLGISLSLLSCGEETDQAASNAAANDEAELETIPVAFEVDIANERRIYDQDWNELAPETLKRMAEQVLAQKIASLGLTPSAVPEFFKFHLTLSEPRGCNVHWTYHYCNGPFSLYVQMDAKEGFDLLDRVGTNMPLDSVEPTHVRGRIIWAVDEIVDTMVESGLLDAMGIETPYF